MRRVRARWPLLVVPGGLLLGAAVLSFALLGQSNRKPPVRSAPSVQRTVPERDATGVTAEGRFVIEFSRRPDQPISLSLTPSDGFLSSSFWKGTAFIVAYSGLRPAMTYRLVVSGSQLWADLKFTTEGGPSPTGIACQSKDLYLSVTYQGGIPGGAVSGSVDLLNRSKADCLLSDRPSLIPRDGRAALSVTQTKLAGAASAPFLLAAGQHARVVFVWSNFCGSVVGAISMTVLLPEGGEVTVPVLSSTGGVLTSPPACASQADPSTMAVGQVTAAD